MNLELGSILFGLSSGAVWGAGDFLGGLGARRASVLGVLIVAELSGLMLLVLSLFWFREPLPTLPQLGWSIAGGLSGTLGLGVLYRGLAVGRASIVAPVSAVVGAALPALFTAVTVGLPDPLTLVGLVVALVAIGLASQSVSQGSSSRALWFGFGAGLGFGAFFILIDAAGAEATLFPLLISRGVSIPVLLLAARVVGARLPDRAVLPVVVASGLLDVGGNVLFLLSSQFGRLDVATILASLYPASTVILSRLVLGERTTRVQQLGVLAALIAIVLIAL